MASIAVLSFYFFFNPEGMSIFPKCPLYNFTGIYCPGCGSQRALHSLLHLNIAGAVGFNLLFLPAVAMVGYHFAIRLFPRRNGNYRKSYLDNRRAPWVILTIVLVFWLLRNLPFYPFDILAP